MNKGVLATLGFTNGLSAYTLETYSNLYEVPFFTLSQPNKKYNKIVRKISHPVNGEENLQFKQKKSLRKRQDEFNEEYEEDTSDTVNSEDPNEYQISMYPDITPLLISLLKYNRWKTVYYIYNHPEGIYFEFQIC